MQRPTGAFLLVCVCLMLVFVAGAVESGRVNGLNYSINLRGFNSWIMGYGLPFRGSAASGNITTTTSTATKRSTASTTSVSTVMVSSSSSSSLPTIPQSWPAIPTWLLTAVAAAALVSASLLALWPRASVRVLDLDATLKEMDVQQRYLVGKWSSKLRNAALLRYYLLMKRACEKVGLPEKAAETPQEYIGRASSFLGVDEVRAEGFADAIDRSRYGEELSEEDTRDASESMAAFTELVREKAHEH